MKADFFIANLFFGVIACVPGLIGACAILVLTGRTPPVRPPGLNRHWKTIAIGTGIAYLVLYSAGSESVLAAVVGAVANVAMTVVVARVAAMLRGMTMANLVFTGLLVALGIAWLTSLLLGSLWPLRVS